MERELQQVLAFVRRIGKRNSYYFVGFLVLVLFLAVLTIQVGKPSILTSRAGLLLGSGQIIDSDTDIAGRTFILRNTGIVDVYTEGKHTSSFSSRVKNPKSISLEESSRFAKDGVGFQVLVLDDHLNVVYRMSDNGQALGSFPLEKAVAISTDILGRIYGVTQDWKVIESDREGENRRVYSVSYSGRGVPIDIAVDWKGKMFILTNEGQVVSFNRLDSYSNPSIYDHSLPGSRNVFVDSIGNVALTTPNSYLVFNYTSDSKLASGMLTDGDFVFSQRLGVADRQILDMDFSSMAKLIDQRSVEGVSFVDDNPNFSGLDIDDVKQAVADFESVFETQQYRSLKIINTEGRERSFETETMLLGCPKPHIYKDDSEIPPEKRNPQWPKEPVLPGMSDRIYLTAQEGNPYGEVVEPQSGDYGIRVGIESGKWDLLASHGICPPVWVKDNLVDVMNTMFSEVNDAQGIPVKPKMIMISWELYDRSFFESYFSYENAMTYVPPWYVSPNLNKGRDINWLIRLVGEEIPPDERAETNIYGINDPYIGAIDAGCPIGNIYCLGAIIHETLHVMDLPDLYWWDIGTGENLINGFTHRTIWKDDIMSNPSLFKLSRYSATNLNRTYDYRVSGRYNNRDRNHHPFWGTYYLSNSPSVREQSFIFHTLPKFVRFKLVDTNGRPISGNKVKIALSSRRCESYPSECQEGFDPYHSQFVNSNYLQDEGFVLMSQSNQASANTTNEEGMVLVRTDLLSRLNENPSFPDHLSLITPNRAIHFMVMTNKNNLPLYSIVEITQLNMAYMAGQTDTADIEVKMTPALKEVRIRPK